MPFVTDTDRVQAEIEVREAIVGRVETAPDVVNVHGRERRPEEGKKVEEVTTVPDPVTQQPITRTVFVKWAGFSDREDTTDEQQTTLILRYNVVVLDEFVDTRPDGSDSEGGHRRRVLQIASALKGDRHLGFDPTQVTHRLVGMPVDTQLIEEDEGGNMHLSVLTLSVEIVGFKG